MANGMRVRGDAAQRVIPDEEGNVDFNPPGPVAQLVPPAPAPFVQFPGPPPPPPQVSPFPTLQALIGIDNARIGDMPAAETELNLRERYGPGGSIDRRLEGLDVNIAGLRAIGTTEGEIAAREVALQRLRGGGLGAGALRGQLAAAQEAALRQQSEQFAQRGLGGGVPAVAMMRAQQGGAIQAAGTEAAFRENLQRSALQDINAMNQEIGNRRLAAQDLLQNYLGSWELPPVDLSALAVVPEDRLAAVTLPGGGAWVDGAWHPAAQEDRGWEPGPEVAEEGEFQGCTRIPAGPGSPGGWDCRAVGRGIIMG